MDWKIAAQKLIDERDAKIPVDWRLSADLLAKYPAGSNIFSVFEASNIFTAQELDITDPFKYDATDLVNQLASGSLKALDCARAFCKRAAVAQQLLNCLVDFFPNEAIQRAQELDDHFAKTGQPIGPLHGLPISIKGHLFLKGKDSGAGAAVLSRAGKLIPDANGTLMQILLDAGAVFYCKTTLPQAVMHLETTSFWGHTLNPYNTKCTPGGSSGGESALISAGGSPMGVGSDIGGSVRGPAGLTAVATIKPTTFRLPRVGGWSPLKGAEGVNWSLGPMTRSLRDCSLFMRVALDAKPWLIEPSLNAIPWRNPNDMEPWKGQAGKLRIGIMRDDGVVRPQPSILRALEAVVGKLKTHPEIEVVDYVPNKHADGIALIHRLYFPDGGEGIRKIAAESGEPVFPLTEWVITRPGVKVHTIQEYWDLTSEREAARLEQQAHWMQSNVDVVLCPTAPGTAPHTNIWNLYDYPGTVFFTGLFSNAKEDAPFATTSTPRNDYEADTHDTYKSAQYDGLPIGLQVVGPRFDDEKTLLASMLIEKAWKA